MALPSVLTQRLNDRCLVTFTSKYQYLPSVSSANMGPAQGNIYMSVIVVPEPGAKRMEPWLSWIPLFSALAVSDCLFGCTGLAVSVKWPNDLLIGDKKIGGILCEQTTTADRTLAIVIGIGLNINAAPDSFPEELRAGATTMAAEAGHQLDRAMILADLLLRLEQRMDRLFHDGQSGMIDEFTRRCPTLGKTVPVALEENRQRVSRPLLPHYSQK